MNTIDDILRIRPPIPKKPSRTSKAMYQVQQALDAIYSIFEQRESTTPGDDDDDDTPDSTAVGCFTLSKEKTEDFYFASTTPLFFNPQITYTTAQGDRSWEYTGEFSCLKNKLRYAIQLFTAFSTDRYKTHGKIRRGGIMTSEQLNARFSTNITAGAWNALIESIPQSLIDQIRTGNRILFGITRATALGHYQQPDHSNATPQTSEHRRRSDPGNI